MNTSAEAADQVVRMSLNGAEAALKITGSASKEVAKLLFKALKDLSKQTKKTKGQMRLSNLVKSGKKLEIYQVADANLKRFCEQAKKYGMIYTVLKDRNKNDGITEVMVKAEDKAKIDRIFERLGLVPESVADVHPEKTKEKDAPERTAPDKSEADKFLDEVVAKPNPTKEEPHTVNPTEARTEKQNQSVPSSKNNRDSKDRSADARTAEERRPSVRKELKEIREEMDREKKPKSKTKNSPTKTAEHKAPAKKKKSKEKNSIIFLKNKNYKEKKNKKFFFSLFLPKNKV